MIVFLDFDGVLNGNNELIRKTRARAKDPNLEKEIDLVLLTEENLDRMWASEMVMENIQNLIDSLKGIEVRIVLSTSWRSFKNIERWNEQFLKIKGWTFEIIGKTPVLETETEMQTLNGYWRTNPRGLEIKTWLLENNYGGKYLILDDDDDMLPEQKENFIQTNSDLGFSKKDKEKVIEFLEKR